MVELLVGNGSHIVASTGDNNSRMPANGLGNLSLLGKKTMRICIAAIKRTI
jgi:hypothetical protein